MLKREVFHLAEHLGGVDLASAHLEVARVPQGRPGSGQEVAVDAAEGVDMPEGVFPFEDASLGIDGRAAFQGRFPGVESHALKPEPVGGEQGPLAAEFLVGHRLHPVGEHHRGGHRAGFL